MKNNCWHYIVKAEKVLKNGLKYWTMKEASGEPRSTFFVTQRISIAIQRGNASCVLGTVPFSKGLESIFDFECPEEFVSDT